MRTKLSVTIVFVVGLALAGTWIASAQGGEPLTLNINGTTLWYTMCRFPLFQPHRRPG